MLVKRSGDGFHPDTVYFPVVVMFLNLNKQQITGFILPSRMCHELEPPCFLEFHLEQHFVLGSGARLECGCGKNKKDGLMSYAAWQKQFPCRADTGHTGI